MFAKCSECCECTLSLTRFWRIQSKIAAHFTEKSTTTDEFPAGPGRATADEYKKIQLTMRPTIRKSRKLFRKSRKSRKSRKFHLAKYICSILPFYNQHFTSSHREHHIGFGYRWIDYHWCVVETCLRSLQWTFSFLLLRSDLPCTHVFFRVWRWWYSLKNDTRFLAFGPAV